MSIRFQRPLSLALGVLATTALGGCYDGDVRGAGYASSAYACETRYGSGYYDAYDPYAYDDGYGYDCYDGADYGRGFVQIGFGGGWYDDYYYPGYGTWMFDNYRNRYPLSGRYLNYWGGRRAWWMHRQNRPADGNWNRPGNRPGSGATRPPVTSNPVRPGRGPGAVRPQPPTPGEATPGRPGRGDWTGRPGGWNRGDRDGTRPGRGPGSGTTTPSTGNPASPGTVRPRPPVTPGETARPRWQGRGDAATRPGGGMTRPPAAERPVRAADPARPSAPPRAAPGARPSPPPRAMPNAPAAREGKRVFRNRNP